MCDPRALRRRALFHERQQTEGDASDEERLERDSDENMHYLPPLALRARAIICSSSLSSSSFSRSDMPSKAEAALAGEPLKKTRTISLSADFFAAVSETNGL